MHFRPNTSDSFIFTEVVTKNEYNLIETFDIQDLVLDIGSHIGSFGYLTINKGCNTYYAFEADKQTYDVLVGNMSIYGERAHCFNCAVWRSDIEVDSLFYSGYLDNGWNPAGGNVLAQTGDSKVRALKFDSIIDQITNNEQKRIKLLKIDCEGSEYPILYTSKKLHLIDIIYMEYHNLNNAPDFCKVDGFKDYSGNELISFLESNGFKLVYNKPTHIHHGMQVGLAKLTRF